ncbi:MAG: hypothetical protein QOE08_554 [Thermoleophilaceae bacterium]|jgi:hypothetical protein|nr:hypothetical protein [Thermoleophilaceae bacterium]
MNGARQAYRWVVFLFVLLVVVQFFLAGLGVFGDQGKTGSDYDPHRAVGDLLSLLSLILLILAAVGRLGRPLLPMTAGLFGLMIVQNLLAGFGEDTQVVGAFHVLNALLIVGLVFHLFQAVRDGVPEPAAAGGPPSTI